MFQGGPTRNDRNCRFVVKTFLLLGLFGFTTYRVSKSRGEVSVPPPTLKRTKFAAFGFSRHSLPHNFRLAPTEVPTNNPFSSSGRTTTTTTIPTRLRARLSRNQQLERQVAKSKLVQYIVDTYKFETDEKGAAGIGDGQPSSPLSFPSLDEDALTTMASRLELVNPTEVPINESSDLLTGVWRLVHSSIPKFRYLAELGCHEKIDMDTKEYKGVLTLRNKWPRVSVQTFGSLVVAEPTSPLKWQGGGEERKLDREDYDNSGENDGEEEEQQHQEQEDVEQRQQQTSEERSLENEEPNTSYWSDRSSSSDRGGGSPLKVDFDCIQVGPFRAPVEDGKARMGSNLGVSTRMLSLFREVEVTYIDRHLKITRGIDDPERLFVWLAIDRFAFDQRILKGKLLEAISQQQQQQQPENQSVDDGFFSIMNLVNSLEDLSTQVLDSYSWPLAQGKWNIEFSTIRQIVEPKLGGWKEWDGAVVLQETRLDGLPSFWIEDMRGAFGGMATEEQYDEQLIMNKLNGVEDEKDGSLSVVIDTQPSLLGASALLRMLSTTSGTNSKYVNYDEEEGGGQPENGGSDRFGGESSSSSSTAEVSAFEDGKASPPPPYAFDNMHPYVRTTFIDKDLRILRAGPGLKDVIVLSRVGGSSPLFHTSGLNASASQTAKRVEREVAAQTVPLEPVEAAAAADWSPKQQRTRWKDKGGALMAVAEERQERGSASSAETATGDYAGKESTRDGGGDGGSSKSWDSSGGAFVMSEPRSAEANPTDEWDVIGGARVVVKKAGVERSNPTETWDESGGARIVTSRPRQEVADPTESWEEEGGARIMITSKPKEKLELGGENIGGAVIWTTKSSPSATSQEKDDNQRK